MFTAIRKWAESIFWVAFELFVRLLKSAASIAPRHAFAAKKELIKRLGLVREVVVDRPVVHGGLFPIPTSWKGIRVFVLERGLPDYESFHEVSTACDELNRLGFTASVERLNELNPERVDNEFAKEWTQFIVIGDDFGMVEDIVRAVKILTIQLATQPQYSCISVRARDDGLVTEHELGMVSRSFAVTGNTYGFTRAGWNTLRQPDGDAEISDLAVYLTLASVRTAIPIGRVSTTASSSVTSPRAQLPLPIPELITKDARMTRIVRDSFRRQAVADAEAWLPSSNSLVLPPRNGVLVIMPVASGGAFASAMRLIEELAQVVPVVIVEATSTDIRVAVYGTDDVVHLPVAEPVDGATHRSNQYDIILSAVASNFGISVILVQHMSHQSVGIQNVAKLLQIPYFVDLHDFYTLCPSHNLLDENGVFCGGTCTSGVSSCSVELWPAGEFPFLKNGTVHEWRTIFDEFVGGANAVAAPTAAAVDVIRRNHNRAGDFIVNAPVDDCTLRAIQVAPLSSSENIRVVILGDLNVQKGSRFVSELAEQTGLEIHLFGSCLNFLPKTVIRHGRYELAALPRLVEEIAPHCAFIPSISFETYSHVLTELWHMGIPTFALDSSGAVSERINESGAGFVLDSSLAPAEIRDEMFRLLADPDAVSVVIRSAAEQVVALRKQSPNLVAPILEFARPATSTGSRQ